MTPHVCSICGKLRSPYGIYQVEGTKLAVCAECIRAGKAQAIKEHRDERIYPQGTPACAVEEE